MIQRMSSLIKPSDLVQLMKNDQVVLVDARTGADVRDRYTKEHLKNAVFVDLENELSKKTGNAAHGGRHPLPPIQEFAALLGKLGITPATHVVVYDDKNGANAAARFWWMLKALGHEKVQVVDGGFKAAVLAGIALSNGIPDPVPAPVYPAVNWQLPVVDAGRVANAAADPHQLVIDVREGFRYRGESEPIDTVAGHIPGAVNVPYIENMDADGNFLNAQQLADKYGEVLAGYDPGDVIVHCGSGVTACHTILAIAAAGFPIPQLYVGSWSEWSRNENPIAKGEN